MNGPLLRVRDLTATVTTRREVIQAVRGISFDINADEAVGFVGESGCGKSVTAKALMRIAPEGAAVGLGVSPYSFWRAGAARARPEAVEVGAMLTVRSTRFTGIRHRFPGGRCASGSDPHRSGDERLQSGADDALRFRGVRAL
ncbi:ATP-binding cassette domain-containing protein [Bosea thiooxidans]